MYGKSASCDGKYAGKNLAERSDVHLDLTWWLSQWRKKDKRSNVMEKEVLLKALAGIPLVGKSDGRDGGDGGGGGGRGPLAGVEQQ